MTEPARLPVWEMVVMGVVLFSGIRGIVRPPAESVYALLGPMAPVFYAALILAAAAAIVGTAVRGPDGLVTILGGMVTLAVACTSTYAGLAVLAGNALYSGSLTILIFAIGAILRAAQILRQLRRLRRALESGPPT